MLAAVVASEEEVGSEGEGGFSEVEGMASLNDPPPLPVLAAPPEQHRSLPLVSFLC